MRNVGFRFANMINIKPHTKINEKSSKSHGHRIIFFKAEELGVRNLPGRD